LPSRPATSLRERPSSSVKAVRPFAVNASSVARRSVFDGFRATICCLCRVCSVHPGFLQRPRAIEQFWFDDAEFAGVEPAEAANRRDLGIEFGIRGI